MSEFSDDPPAAATWLRLPPGFVLLGEGGRKERGGRKRGVLLVHRCCTLWVCVCVREREKGRGVSVEWKKVRNR